MSLALMVFATGLGLFGLVVVARGLEARTWRASLTAYRLGLPSGLSAEDISAWLAGIAAATHAPRFSLIQPPPVALEVTATSRGIGHVLLVPARMEGAVLAGLRAALPGVRLEEAPDALTTRLPCTVTAEARLRGLVRPLAFERAERASAAVLAALQPLGHGEAICLQWILLGAGTPRPIHPTTAGLSDVHGRRDSEDVRLARVKQREPLLHAVLRVGVTAQQRARAYSLFGRVWGTVRGLNVPGALMVRRLLPSVLVGSRLRGLRLPLTRWPVLANARELAGLMGFPLQGTHLPGLPLAVARQLPPPLSLPQRGTVFGVSNYPGLTERPLALSTGDRLRHTWVIGPTGVGKSTLLANMIVQDVAAGRGVAVLDPKGDLATEVLNRIPARRHDDVLVIDASATDYPVGINVLDSGSGEHARELAVDHLVHLMSSLWHSSWGPRTSDVLRNALLTLVHTEAADGSRLTLVELPELLLNPVFRGFITAQPGVPGTVRQFWTMYAQLSEGERAQVIGPSLNKLRSFTTRTALRLMLGQSQGVRLDELFTKRRVVIVNLAKGTLGSDTTALVGSLVTAGLWQATLQRASVPPERRHPVMIYLDEFQDFLRLPLALADMLAQARGLGVGFILSHQYLGQLTEEVKAAVLGTVRSHLAFQLDVDDARTLASRFAPLSDTDLRGLGAFEIALRPCVNGVTLGPTTGRTLPLPSAMTDGPALATASRQRFGRPRAEVEAALHTRVSVRSKSAAGLGREPPGGPQ